MKIKHNKCIAFYIGSLAKGGAERVIVNLAEYFYASGYRVYLVTKLKEEAEYEHSSGITRMIADITKEEETNNRAVNLIRRIRKLRHVWKKIKPDAVISFIGKNNLMAIASAFGLRIPVIVSVRSDPKRELFQKEKLSFFLFRFASGIVLQTNEAKMFFPKYLQDKSVILQNSLNPAFLPSGQTVRRKKEIVMVGRMDDNKNQIMAIRAFIGLSQKYPDWTMCLYGEGERTKEWQTYVEKNNAQDRIVFMGQCGEIQNRIKDASIFILPSKCEGMPNSLIEAMTLGLCVIATDCPCGGPRELIQDGLNGYLIPVDDDRALADILEKMIEDDKLRENMGRNASQIIHKVHPDVVNNAWKSYVESFITCV